MYSRLFWGRVFFFYRNLCTGDFSFKQVLQLGADQNIKIPKVYKQFRFNVFIRHKTVCIYLVKCAFYKYS